MPENIKSKARASIIWSSVERFSVQGLGFCITIVLSRLVSPSDYGLIAMLSIFMSVSQIFIDCGFSNSLIQNKQRTEEDYSTVFYMNMFVGLLCYGLLFIFSPLISDFYNQPELSSILKVYGLTLIISSITLVQRTRLYITFRYRRLSAISITSIIISGAIATIMAYKDYGVWALVVYSLVSASVGSFLIWISSRWRPKLIFSKQAASSAYTFGSKLLAANLLNAIVSNIYTLIIGKQYSAKNLGYFSRAQSISYVFPSQLSNMLNQATYPVLCELQSEPARLKNMFSAYIRYAAILCFPLMTLLASLSEPLVRILLTDKWLPTVPFIQILAIGYMLDPIMRLNAIVLSVTGKTKLSLQAEITKKVLLIMLLLITLPFGVIWLTIGISIYALADIFSVSFFTKKVVPITFLEQVRLFFPYFLYCLLMYTAITLLISRIDNSFAQLSVGIIVGIAVYAIMLFLFSKKTVSKMMHIIKNR